MPMGSYVGNNQNFAPIIGLPDSSDALTPGEFNVGFENLSDRTSFLALRTRGNPGQNWPLSAQPWGNTTTVNVIPYSNNNPPVWDPTYAQWLMYAVDSTGTYFISQSFDGINWNAINGDAVSRSFGANTGNASSQPDCALMVRPSDGLISFVSGHVTGTYNQATNTFANISIAHSVLNAGSYYGAFLPLPALLPTLSGRFVAINSFQGSGDPSIHTAPFWSEDGFTWNAATTWTPPAGFSANRYGLVFANGITPVIAAFSGTAGCNFYMTTPDGKTWTSQSMPTLLAGEQVVGAVWDQTLQALYGGIFGGLCFLVSSSTQARFFIQGGTLASTIPHQCVGLASNNGELVTMTQFGSTRVGAGAGSVTPLWRLIQSVDLGLTWQLTPFNSAIQQMASYTGSGYAYVFGLVGNGSQYLFTANTAYFAVSQAAGQLTSLPF